MAGTIDTVDPDLQLRDLGIVSLSQAIQDTALGAADQARLGGLMKSDMNKLFWCTLCSNYYTRSTAYRHRDRHLKELQKGDRTDALAILHRTLDEKYGMDVLYDFNFTKHFVQCCNTQ
jgi:hypothetical protein